jgi:hypothetical protein
MKRCHQYCCRCVARAAASQGQSAVLNWCTKWLHSLSEIAGTEGRSPDTDMKILSERRLEDFLERQREHKEKKKKLK